VALETIQCGLMASPSISLLRGAVIQSLDCFYVCVLLFCFIGYRLLAVCSHHKERFSQKFSGWKCYVKPVNC